MARPAKKERNLRIVEMRDDPNKKFSFRSIAKQMDLAESTVREIYLREKARNQSFNENA